MHRLILLVLALSLVACGGAADPLAAATIPATPSTVPDFPVTVAAGNGDITMDERPDRIISLSATATESLFAIGAGPQVVAVDAFSNYPPEAPTTELSGFDSNIEALAAYEPDLVIVFFDPGELVAGLEAVGIPVLVQLAPVSLDEAYAQISQLGAVTGHREEADRLVASMQEELDAIVATVPGFEEPPTYYHELDATLYSVTSTTFLGALYSLVGLANIADPADTDGYGYPQLSAEFIIESDPDIVFLADTICCAESSASVAARPGWDVLTAVKDGHVIELDDDIASRWGPRIVDLVGVFAAALSSLGADG